MPKCQNCGSQVTARYLRVFAPDDLEEDGVVRACPNCTKVRVRGGVRTGRSKGAAYQEGEVE